MTDEMSDYDPIADLIATPDERPAHVQAVQFNMLDPLRRLLLATDGTVTKFLEALTLEPVVIEGLQEYELVLSERHAQLGADSGTRVVGRQVALVGKFTNTFHASAASLTIPVRLPRDLRNELKHNEAGIGQAIQKVGLETRRKILWYGLEDNARVIPELREHFPAGCYARSYLIITQHKPVMLIHERFPVQVDRSGLGLTT
ncbi:MAG: chorismate pyruvate-lyase family protein [Chromatiales bacterium]|nr:chorismate pyruvate-lyase family protein [Chromatiales bacterium]